MCGQFAARGVNCQQAHTLSNLDPVTCNCITLRMVRATSRRRIDLATPALLLELDALDRNIETMRRHARSANVALRPHAKAHKCIEVAQRAAAAGAIGVSCATIAEAETMASGGLTGILVTAPLVTANAIARLGHLLLRGADITIVLDHPAAIDLLAAIGTARDRALPVLVDVDVGMGRTGCTGIAQAVDLARAIAAAPHLHYAGIQAYWGNLQQVVPFSERQRLVMAQVAHVRAVATELTAAGFSPAIVSGGGTGTHRIDSELGLFTEIQPGSYLFMDSCYGAIDVCPEGNPFERSLFVAASVVSANRPGRVIVDAGWKAFATDSGQPVPLRGAPPGAVYRFMGDEHGAVDFEGDVALPLGSTIEFLTSHCDPTVNLYSAFHVMRDDQVIDVWPIRARH